MATGATIGRDALPHGIRHRFPLLERQVYLNSCSQGVLSDAVRDAYAAYLRDWDEKGAPWEYWMERTESARASFAGLIVDRLVEVRKVVLEVVEIGEAAEDHHRIDGLQRRHSDRRPPHSGSRR